MSAASDQQQSSKQFSWPESSDPFFGRLQNLSDVASVRDLYNDWAKQYDKDLAAEDYVAPRLAVDALLSAIDDNAPSSTKLADMKVLDAGCGTGLVGVFLAKAGASSIDGLDLSPGMLDTAKKSGIYHALEEADLSKPIAKGDQSYDTITCVGTLTTGHVGPEVLSEFARVVKNGGFIVATVLDKVWESGGYRSEVETLVSNAKVKVLRADLSHYRKTYDARMLVLQKL